MYERSPASLCFGRFYAKAPAALAASAQIRVSLVGGMRHQLLDIDLIIGAMRTFCVHYVVDTEHGKYSQTAPFLLAALRHSANSMGLDAARTEARREPPWAALPDDPAPPITGAGRAL